MELNDNDKQRIEQCPKCRTTTPENCHSMYCPMRKEEPIKPTTQLIDEVMELDNVLERDGYKDWCYQRLTIKKLIDFITVVERYERQINIDLLERYTKFLQKHGYIDTDATCEEPYAIDEFLKESLKTK